MKKIICMILSVLLLAAVMATPVFAADGGSAAISSATVIPGASAELVISLEDFADADTIKVEITEDSGMALNREASQWLKEASLCEIHPVEAIAVFGLNEAENLNGNVLKLVFTTPETEGEYTVTCEITVKNGNDILATVAATGKVTVDLCAEGHTPAKDKAKAATCTETGLTEGSHCSVCKEVLKKQETVKAKGHSYGKYVSNDDATCTADGTKTAKCANCDEKDTVADKGSAKGHSFGQWTEKDGKEVRTCSACNATEEREIEKPAVEFPDVVKGSFYDEPVQWAVQKEITSGVPQKDDTVLFKPDDPCIRAQVVTFLWRAAGKPEPNSTVSPFEDVTDPTAYYYKAVLWAVEKGITTGLTNTSFGPDQPCNRGQVATFLWRYYGKPESGNVQPLPDMVEGEFYYDAVLWALENGVTTGIPNEEKVIEFQPDTTCNRAQIVTFLHRAMN